MPFDVAGLMPLRQQQLAHPLHKALQSPDVQFGHQAKAAASSATPANIFSPSMPHAVIGRSPQTGLAPTQMALPRLNLMA
jgi:hypothetical protein